MENIPSILRLCPLFEQYESYRVCRIIINFAKNIVYYNEVRILIIYIYWILKAQSFLYYTQIESHLMILNLRKLKKGEKK